MTLTLRVLASLSVLSFHTVLILQAQQPVSTSAANSTLISTSAAPSAPSQQQSDLHASSTIKEQPSLNTRSHGIDRGITFGSKFGTLGTGAEVTLPVARKVDMRLSGTIFNLTFPYEESGVTYNADLKLRSILLQADIYPHQGNFRISPGLLAYNNNTVKANVVVAPGSSIDLGDGTYFSSPTDPITAKAAIRFGYKVAPAVTVGWKNILPHAGGRINMPFEIGAAYTGTPSFTLDVSGSGCSNEGCSKITSEPDGLKNIEQERQTWKDNINPIRALPIVSLGFNVRFGRIY